jgi:hypothetical protein
LVRNPLSGFEPRPHQIFGVYVSNLNLSINGEPIERQWSRERNDGNWVRIVIVDVDDVRKTFSIFYSESFDFKNVC